MMKIDSLMGLKSYLLSIGFWSRPWFVFSHMVSGSESQTRRGFPTWERIFVAIAALYFLIAYLILPRLWKRHETHLAVIKESPRVTDLERYPRRSLEYRPDRDRGRNHPGHDSRRMGSRRSADLSQQRSNRGRYRFAKTG